MCLTYFRLWMYPYCIPTSNQGGWMIGYVWVTYRYKPYHHDIVEARIHFRLDYISLLHVYKVFKPLPVQWMDIWMYPYCIPTREVG